MLQYRRRDSKIKLIQENFEEPSALAILTYCNWSYSPKSHNDILNSSLQNISKELRESGFRVKEFN